MTTQLSAERRLCVTQCYLSANSKLFDMNPHQHGFLEMNYQMDGKSRYWVNGQQFDLDSGDLLILDSRLPHKKVYLPGQPGSLLGLTACLAENDEGGALWGSILEGCPQLRVALSRMAVAVVIPHAEPICSFFQTMLDEYASGNNPVRLTALFTELLFLIDRLLAGQRPPSPAEQLHKRYAEVIKLYIRKNYAEINSLQDIERQMGLNSTYLERVFHEVTGCSIWQFLITTRLAAAAQLLAQTGIPIGQIDERIGMRSRQSFYLQFKKRYGCSPSQYRALCRTKTPPPT